MGVAEELTEAGLKEFDACASRHVDGGDVPGVVALVAHRDQVHVATAGELSIGGAPVQRDSLFRIASTTKPVTAAATLALVGEGRIGLDEPVDRLLPELAEHRVLRRPDGPLDDTVPATRSITTRDLLTFTFGFGFAIEMFAAAPPPPILAAERESGLHTLGPPCPDLQPPPDEWMAALGRASRCSPSPASDGCTTREPPCSACSCRGRPGTSLDEVFASRLFEPLGMRDTAMWTTRDRSPRDGLRPDRPRTRGLGPARRRVEPTSGVPRRRRRSRVDGRRPAGVRPAAAASAASRCSTRPSCAR